METARGTFSQKSGEKACFSKKKKKCSENNAAASSANNVAIASGAGDGAVANIPSINVIPLNTGSKPKLDQHFFVDPTKRTEFKAVTHMKQCFQEYRCNRDKQLSDGSIGYACEEKRSPQKCPDRMRVYEDGTKKSCVSTTKTPGVKTRRLKVSKNLLLTEWHFNEGIHKKQTNKLPTSNLISK